MITLNKQNELLKKLKKYKKKLMAYSGVKDIAIGYKFTNDKMTDQIAFIVYVNKKFEKSELLEEQILPSELDGKPIDVMEYDPIFHPLEDPYSVVNPLIGGLSISNTRFNTSGTLAAIVYDTNSGGAMGLTNHHVLIGNRSIFSREGIPGDNINQPAFCPNTPVYNVGQLVKGNSSFDCSVFSVNNLRQIELVNQLNGIIGPISGTTSPLLDLLVKKTGARTGLTYGRIIAVKISGDITIGPNPLKPAHNNEISMPGDSGSLWVTDTSENLAVGLHWGGEKRGPDRAYAVNINSVLSKLNIRF